MQTMTHFNRGRPSAIWRSMKKAEETKISMTNADDSNHISNKLLHLIKHNFACETMKGAEVIYLSMDYEDVVREIAENMKKQKKTKGKKTRRDTLESLENVWGGQFLPKKGKKGKKKNYHYVERDVDEIVADAMFAKKPVLIVLDINDYNINDDKKEVEYETHSTCMFLLPTEENNKYNMYYFNSHGSHIAVYNEYSFICDDNSIEKMTFDASVEFLIMDEFAIMFSNTYNHVYEEFLTKGKCMEVVYKHDSSHNYLGMNLQNGDAHGICFAYPLIILSNLLMNFDREDKMLDENKSVKLPSLKHMFKMGYFTEAITSMFLDFSPELNRLFIAYMSDLNDNSYEEIHSLNAEHVTKVQEAMIDDLDITLEEEENDIFGKKVTHTIVAFLTQSELQKKLIDYL